MKNFYVIDGSSYFYRAFFGNKSRLSTSKGLPTNAIYTFITMLQKLVQKEDIDYIAIVYDKGKPLKRLELFPEYKANRQKMPDDLRVQIPYFEKASEALSIREIELPNVEADDIIGTLTTHLSKEDVKCTIVSGDKDFMQLLGDNVVLLDTMKERLTAGKDVPERIGVEASQVIDYLSIVGDTADNIPGAAGIGPKGAAKLLTDFKDLEGIYDHIDELTKGNITKLTESRENVFLSRKLATIETDLEFDFNLEDFAKQPPDREKQVELFTELEFKSFLEGIDAPAQEETTLEFETIYTEEQLKALVEKLEQTPAFAFDTETTSLNPVEAKLVGISFSYEKGKGYYIPVGHHYSPTPMLPPRRVHEALQPLFSNPDIIKVAHNLKYDWAILQHAGYDLKAPFADTMIMSYLLEPDRSQNSLDFLAQSFFNRTMISYKEVCGVGKNEISFAEVDVEKASEYSSEDAEVTFCLYDKLAPQLKEEEKSQKVCDEIEMPLVEVLKDMETKGVRIDTDLFTKLSQELDYLSTKCVEGISEMLEGEEVNLNSPKQLAYILFEKLGLKPVKKTKTGYSTDISVLETLAFEHDLPAKILEYRQHEKMKSTYVDKLPTLITPKTGRIHASFNQTIAATGRLSSNNPNLQNIPVRTEMGRKIRQGFVPEPGYAIIAADYSQIELRLLAHLSGDRSLRDAFIAGRDIHSETAARLHDCMLELVTDDMRRIAKTVNFGIIYGQTPFGLAKQLKISMPEAKRFITSYFELFPRITSFIQGTIESTKTTGYSETLFGRKRYIPDINAANKNAREYAERTAVNSTIQGTAADIIKKAMITLHHRIIDEKLPGSMIIQVHDELLFEVQEDRVDDFIAIIRQEMEHVIELSVPLTVDIHAGPSWQDAKG